jgi:hypothetical protein
MLVYILNLVHASSVPLTMLSKEELEHLSFVLDKTTRSPTSQYDFNDGLLEPTKKSWKRGVKCIYIALGAFNTVLVLAKLPQTLSGHGIIPTAIHGICFIVSLGVLAQEAYLWAYVEETMEYFNFNQTFRFSSEQGNTSLYV